MKVISVLAQKGGTGKTSISTHLGAGLAKEKKTVLMIDFDPQTNLSQSYAIKEDYTIYNFMNEDIEGFKLSKREDILFLAGDKKLWSVIFPLDRLKSNLTKLANIKIDGKKIDYVIIDCSPMPPLPSFMGKTPIHSLNGLALYASDYVLCPINTSQHSVFSMIQLWNDIVEFQKNYKTDLKLLGFVINRFVENRTEFNFWLNEIKSQLSDELLFNSIIHESVEIEKSTREGYSVFKGFPTGRSANEYKNLVDELLNKIKK